MLGPTIVVRLAERGVPEPHHRIGRHLIDPCVEARPQVVEQHLRFLVSDVEHQVDIDALEPADRHIECPPIDRNGVGSTQVAEYLTVERLCADD